MNVHCTSRIPKIDEELGSTNELESIAYCLSSSVVNSRPPNKYSGGREGYQLIGTEKTQNDQNNDAICYHSQSFPRGQLNIMLLSWVSRRLQSQKVKNNQYNDESRRQREMTQNNKICVITL